MAQHFPYHVVAWTVSSGFFPDPTKCISAPLLLVLFVTCYSHLSTHFECKLTFNLIVMLQNFMNITNWAVCISEYEFIEFVFFTCRWVQFGIGEELITTDRLFLSGDYQQWRNNRLWKLWPLLHWKFQHVSGQSIRTATVYFVSSQRPTDLQWVIPSIDRVTSSTSDYFQGL